MFCFDGIQRGNYFGGEHIRRTKVEMRVGKLKNGKDEVTEEMFWMNKAQMLPGVL